MAILDMLNAASMFRLRLVVYGVLVFFSFFIIIGVAVMKNEVIIYSCPLYCNSNDGCGSSSNCNYPLTIGILFQLLYLLLRIASIILMLLGKLSADGFPFSDPFEFIYVAIDLFVCFLTFVGACILSAGTNSTCDSLPGYCDNDKYNDWLSGSKAAQAGSWISTFLWLAVGLVGFLCVFREGRIPFIQGGAKSSAQTADPTAPPPMETPPSNPDDMSPKY